MTREGILDLLNGYPGDNVWQDVILKLDDYDEAATDLLNGVQWSDRFVLQDGTVIRYSYQHGHWYVPG